LPAAAVLSLLDAGPVRFLHFFVAFVIVFVVILLF
jgi:hypothetical protein